MNAPEPPPVQRRYVEPPPVIPQDTFDRLGSQFREAVHGDPRGSGRSVTRVGVILRIAAGIYAALFLLMLLSGVKSIVENESGALLSETVRSLVVLIFGPPVGIGFIGVYAIPSILAYLRNHRNLIPLVIINAAFGWTMLGWIVCLAWAFIADLTPHRPGSERLVRHDE